MAGDLLLMTAPDYAMTAQVADALRLAGQRDFGDALDDVMAARLTSTEILMDVSHTLEGEMPDPGVASNGAPTGRETADGHTASAIEVRHGPQRRSTEC